MVTQIRNELPSDSAAVHYCQALCDRAGQIRMPELFTNHPRACAGNSSRSPYLVVGWV